MKLLILASTDAANNELFNEIYRTCVASYITYTEGEISE